MELDRMVRSRKRRRRWPCGRLPRLLLIQPRRGRPRKERNSSAPASSGSAGMPTASWMQAAAQGAANCSSSSRSGTSAFSDQVLVPRAAGYKQATARTPLTGFSRFRISVCGRYGEDSSIAACQWIFLVCYSFRLDEPDLPEVNIGEKEAQDRKKASAQENKNKDMQQRSPSAVWKDVEMTKLLGVPEMKRKTLFCCKNFRAGDLL